MSLEGRMWRTEPYAVNFGVTACKEHKIDTLLCQSLPIGRICMNQSSSGSGQVRYQGNPVKLTIHSTFENFQANVPDNENVAFFPSPTWEKPDLFNESAVADAFRANILTPLQSYFRSFQVFRNVSQPPSYLFTPDLIISDIKNVPIMCIEIKPCNTFCTADITNFDVMSEIDRIKILAENTPLPNGILPEEFLKCPRRQKVGGKSESLGLFNFRCSLRQLKHFLFNMNVTVAFGMLSSYCHTYLVILHRDQENKSSELRVSPVLKFNDKTVLRRIAEFIQFAISSVQEPLLREHHTLTPSKFFFSDCKKGVIRKRGEKRRKKDDIKGTGKKPSKSTYTGHFVTLGNVIGNGRTGTVLELFDENKKLYAVKFVEEKSVENLNHELDNELYNEEMIYDILIPLQGDVLPIIYMSGLLDGWKHVIVMEYLEAESMNKVVHLSEEQKTAVIAALDKVHKRGVLHGDIRENNILLHRNNHRQAYLIDFGFASKCNTLNDFIEEKLELMNLLELK
ncbi:uncharacterized protein [Parasteatoda tepidariorum]|uniref:uncharacterized protein isoform X1 n=2 Tax=Parasteatoda tepidariorum TaxID=114398 RepID=UPI001C71F216|nr:uncharacterized protein LOC107439707 isoform X1 [Parasteatoda tepidariorum]